MEYSPRKIKINNIKERLLILSPTVQAGIEPELKKTDFNFDKPLGKGAFGEVWKATHLETNRVVAIKVIDKLKVKQSKMQGQLVNELKIMYSISHNNIVGIYNHFEDDENCYLVIEYAGGGQVYSKMMSLGGKRFPEKDAAHMVYELCLSLDYLHKRSIIHRDIKPENLLLSDNSHRPTLKLADFGWSNFEEASKKRETYCGTVDYLAPEMADRHHKHDRGVDIWCVGVLIFELLTGKAPFSPEQKPGITSAQAQRDTKKNIITLNYVFSEDFPVFAKDLVKKILTLDPAKRL
jgi:serine/threonine protein kinase